MKYRNKQKAMAALQKKFPKAERMLKSDGKITRFLRRLEKKITKFPKIGDKLSHIVTMMDLLRSYIVKEYADFPVSSLVAVVACLLYFLSPIDILPDVIPGIGLSDDITVAALCWIMIETDIAGYIEWRDNREIEESIK